MLNGMTVLRFENMPELARSGGKKTAQCTHCAVDNPTQILLLGLPSIKPLLRTLKFILDWYSIQRVGSKFKAVAALVQLSPLKDVEANNRLR